MEQGASRLWNEMLDEFRALGGTAENICLRDGPFGRGLFPIDRAKPISIRIPDSLLVESKYASIENGTFRLQAETPVGTRERKFLENYQHDFSWGVSHHETEDLLQMFHSAPAELRELLRSPFSLDCWLVEPTPGAILERFLVSRVIEYKGKMVIMPIVELANHGWKTRYRAEDGVGLSGRFDDEILVTYKEADPLLIFWVWGFVSRIETFALSLSFGLNQETFRINREAPRYEEGRNPLYPDIQKKGGKVILSHVLLGHRQHPWLPRGIFHEVARKARLERPDQLFEQIQHVNRTQFLRLAELSEAAAPQLGHLLRRLAYAQLEAMSNNFGGRKT